jgi:hypothetical protein
MKKNIMVCDGCEKQQDITSDTTGWYSLNQLVPQSEYKRLAEDLMHGGKTLEQIQAEFDQGEFCSLVCVANWASATAGMRELSEPPG